MNKKKIAFLFNKKTNPYAGEVRPFINWGEELSKNGYEVYFLLMHCSKEFNDYFEGMRINKIEAAGEKELSDILVYEKPDICITDDRYSQMKLIMELNKAGGTKTLIYVQIFFGMHSIGGIFDLSNLKATERLIFYLVKLIPFNFLKPAYKNLLQKSNAIVCNSKFTADILHAFYGIEPTAIIYPPVNTEIFKSTGSSRARQVILYLGSSTGGDTNEKFLRKICRTLNNRNLDILVMGNEILAESLRKDFGVKLITNATDRELAEIYSRCMLTECPQKWEPFGYVVAESISCKTPVLAFNCLGPAEIVTNTGCGFLANNSEEFLSILENMDTNLKNLDYKEKILPFDGKLSTKQLEAILENVR